MPKKTETFIEVAGREVRISSPDKPWFPDLGLTKLDVVEYWRSLGDAALRGVRGRPMAMERFVKGVGEPPFFQKRAPKRRPDWIDVVTLKYPSRRTADEVVVTDLAQLLWVVNLGCLTLHPHPIRATDLEHPDELRIDLDPIPGVPWSEVRDVAMVTRDVLQEHGLVGWPKTSGKRGLHIWVRIHPRWPFKDVRRAALAVAREVEARMPERATSAWWKEERRGVFVDYNQNAKDRTTAAAWSVRPTPTATVSMPLLWEEVPDCDPIRHNVATAPARLQELGDPHAGIDEAVGDLTSLLALAGAQEARGPQERQAVATVATDGRRQSTKPMITIGESEDEAEALAGLQRWKERHSEVAALLEPHHVLIDKNRGRYRLWTRIRVNLEAVPTEQRPAQEALDPDDAPTWGGPDPQH
ncbi:MAG: DNA polymerase domain-containing protein [Myxococcales bacterium]|nr:DNA polymerase domain-containing protein [Myxococcales bacterium]